MHGRRPVDARGDPKARSKALQITSNARTQLHNAVSEEESWNILTDVIGVLLGFLERALGANNKTGGAMPL